MLGRAVVPAVFVAIAFAIVQSQVANLIVLPGQPDAPANNQPRAWMLVPLPKLAQPDPKAAERERWEKRGHELATLLRPFDKPCPFDGTEHGYKLVFPGRPTTPQFHSIDREGTTWYYEEQRLGRLSFTANWDKAQRFFDGGADRRLLDWSKMHYQKEMERLHGENQRWRETNRYFLFQNKYEAAEVIDYYHFVKDDDYYGPQMCRALFILKDLDLYQLKVEGNAEIVSSKLADDFFHSFELVPKVAKN